MNVVPAAIPEVLILESKVFGDAWDFFIESFNQKVFDETVGHHVDFVQDNYSRSSKGVLRAGGTTNCSSRKASWCAACAVQCSTWRWTSASHRRPLANGSVSS